MRANLHTLGGQMPFPISSMAASSSTTLPNLFGIPPNAAPAAFPYHLNLVSFPDPNKAKSRYLASSKLFVVHSAAKQQQQTGLAKKRYAPNTNSAKSKKKEKPNSKTSRDTKRVCVDDAEAEVFDHESPSSSLSPQSIPLPKPPAGFVVDEQGRVLMASNKRIATIIDPTNNLPLECVIRRVFRSERGDECMLLSPVDTPVQILKSTNIEGWSAVSDDEVEAILPTAAYALAKIHMHLVHSGFCYTARGGFCYAEDGIFEFRTGDPVIFKPGYVVESSNGWEGIWSGRDAWLGVNPQIGNRHAWDDGQDVDGLPTEGIEITCFHFDGSHYMIYTPSDPLLFVAVKDEDGVLRIADDELLDDPVIMSAIDEETEFNALVEEEAALMESSLGEG